MSPVLCEQRWAARCSGPSERLPFWFVLGKQNEHITRKYLYLYKLPYKPPSFACPKEGARKGHPAEPALRAPLRFSLLPGR